MKKTQTLSERYEELAVERRPYLDRAKRYAGLTQPALYPEQDAGYTAHTANELGWQSYGAQCLNNLSNKLDTTLFPPQRSFHRLEFSPKVKKALKEAGVSDEDLAPSLSKIENTSLSLLPGILPRTQSVLSMKHCIVSGNSLQFRLNRNQPYTTFGLNSYVTRRDFSGSLIEIVLQQRNAFGNLPQEVQDKARLASKRPHLLKEDMNVELYTSARLRKDGYFDVYQEVEGAKVSPSYRVKREDLPFRVLVWNLMPGEHYGRGHCEDYASDLHVIDFLSEAIAKGMFLMSDVKYLVKPNSYTSIDHLVSSPTGEFLQGNIDDVGVLQLERYADFTPIANVLEEYRRRVGEAFLLSSSVRRDAERVTAYELRMAAQDLEAALGGIYSHFADTYQRPLATELTKAAISQLGEMVVGVDFKSEWLQPQVVTGIEGLGRMNELDKIVQFVEIMGQAQNLPEAMQQRILWDKLSSRTASQISLDLDFIMTEDAYQQQVAQQQQAMAQQQLLDGASRAIPEVVKQGGKS